jgi:hypothetical protein
MIGTISSLIRLRSRVFKLEVLRACDTLRSEAMTYIIDFAIESSKFRFVKLSPQAA